MNSDFSQEKIFAMASRWLNLPEGPLRIHTDTTDFFNVEYNDVVLLDRTPYLIRHNAKEGRFGLDDEVKHWVKRAVDLTDGSLKIIKLVFYEKFVANIGGITFECFRSPQKEARILDLVGDHQNFMHGKSVRDEKGNIVRIIDFILGKPLSAEIEELKCDHQSYFHELFPGMLDRFLQCLEGIRFLHGHGEKHGDIRRDHIMIERESGIWRWIDFDFNYRHRENMYGYDLFGLGNILIFLAGKKDISLFDLKKQNHPLLSELTDNDLNIVFNNRVANLKKIYPYIPESFNRVLLHFSKGANWFYENTAQLAEDLITARKDL